ncbi:MAG TPA: hypothetical protein EYQ09_03885 [Flavobacteriales bacterium]|nr:hypothetical protein [Flavobacteriales bacterium]
MLNKIFKSGLIGVFALVMIVTFTSCEKEKETTGVIIVKNSNGVVVPNASVTLFPDQIISPSGVYPDPSLTKSKWTDANGQAEFTYELEAILNIEVTKIDGNSTYTGVNIIRLLKEKTVTKVVEIN